MTNIRQRKKTKKALQKPIWIFGGIAGVLSAMVEFWFYSSLPAAIEQSQSQAMYLIKIAIMIICIVFALVLVKKLKGGIISNGRAIFSGLMVSLVRGAFMILAFLILYYPDGSFYREHEQQALIYAEEKIGNNADMEEDKKTKAIEDAQVTIKRQFTPLGYSTFALGSSMATGLVISVLMAAFIAKNMMYKDLDESN